MFARHPHRDELEAEEKILMINIILYMALFSAFHILTPLIIMQSKKKEVSCKSN